MQLPGAKTPVSPKVLSGANWSGYATLILTVLGYITPDMLTGLGHFAPLVYGVVIGATYALGAYLKADPARDAGFAALAAQLAAAAPSNSLRDVLSSLPATGTVVVNNPAAPASTDAPTDPAPAETPAAPAATN